MFKRIKLSHGIFFVLGVLTLVQVASSSWNIYSYLKNEEQVTRVADNYRRISELSDAYSVISTIRSQVWKLSFLMSNGLVDEQDLQRIGELRNQYIAADEKIRNFVRLSAQGSAEDVKHSHIIEKFYNDAKEMQLKNITMLEKHDFSNMANLSGKFNPTQELLDELVETNRSINDKVVQPTISAAKAGVNRAIILSSILVALCVIFTLIAIMWCRKYVVKKIHQLLTCQAAIGKGDLSVPIPVDGCNEIDALAKGLADMQDSLSETIRAVRAGTASIYTSVQEIVMGNNDLSSRTEEQASALEQTAASMEQLTSTVKNSVENTRQVAGVAVGSSELARHGCNLTRKMVETMGMITQSSQKINEIIGVIDGIAFQTNILALNAAVEAARAGAHGQGFAVVATEVRSLALRSAQAAKEIKTLINASVAHVRSGNELTAEVDQSIQKMMEGSINAQATLEEISKASEEQSRGIDQVSLAVSEMDTVTQQNAALVEQSAAATGSLEDQIRRLNQIVSFFKVDHHDSNDLLTNPSIGYRL